MAVGLKFQTGRAYTRATSGYQASATQSWAGIMANYRRFVKHVEEVTPGILLAALEPTFEKSQEYCPKDSGALVNSGYLVVESFRGKPRVAMGYGRGGNPTYAAAVHENLEWRHKEPTRAKWLQVALEEDDSAIRGRIVDGLRSIVR